MMQLKKPAACAEEETCFCGKPAWTKVEEVIFFDDPSHDVPEGMFETEAEFEKAFDRFELETEYGEYIMEHADGDRIICNGDTLVDAMEDGYLYEGFKASKVVGIRFERHPYTAYLCREHFNQIMSIKNG